jgi:hypothetical protein
MGAPLERTQMSLISKTLRMALFGTALGTGFRLPA